MKTVVSVNEIDELEIKPQSELDQWKKLVKEEILSRWEYSTELYEVPCPVCNSEINSPAFDKFGFKYVECNDCKAIFARTRPKNSELHWWYTQSNSANFWQQKLLTLSAESRKSKIVEPRALWILDGISEYISKKDIKLTDISFFGGPLVEVLAGHSTNIQITSSGILSYKENVNSVRVAIDSLPAIDNPGILKKTDVLIAIDVLDRVRNIKSFMADLEDVVNPGGVVFATCPVSSGFEIQSLWELSPSLNPPDKLNLPSVQGLIDLFSGSEWEILELSTPGMFDIQSIKREMNKSKDVKWPRSLHALLDHMDKQGVEQFTEYLQSQRLSSFARIVIRRISEKI
jgi:hypothetical protein